VKISGDIDAGVESILDLIIPLTDTQETGNKVTLMKQDAMMSLRKAIDYYATERQKLEGELARSVSGMTKEQMADQVGRIDDKVDQRIDDMLTLSSSFEENWEVEKYEYSYDPYRELYRSRVTEEYKQNKKVQRRVIDSRDSLIEGLQKSMATLNDRLNRYERLLAYQVSEDNAVAIKKLIDETNVRLDERKSQLQSLGDSNDNPESKAIGKGEFKIVMQMVTEQKAEIRSNFDLMRRIKSEYDTALVRYNNAERLRKSPLP
jgi:hypothetical protein